MLWYNNPYNLLFVTILMGNQDKSIICANSPSQEDVNDVISKGLSDFNFEFVGELTSRLVKTLGSTSIMSGFLTHFPMGVEPLCDFLDKDDDYAGAAEMIRRLRVSRPDIPILVYTGAGCECAESSESMRSYILGSGASDVVFKYNVQEDIEKIREKMSRLLERL